MRVLTVSQALSYLRELLDSDLVLGDVWVSGEVSGARTQPSGHTYFTLKDAGAQLRSVLFRPAQVRQRRMVDYLTQGAQVIVHGRLTVYEARGELQIVVDFVQPEGVGLRHAQFERLRVQLEEEGLFDPARKRSLPRFPRRVGVVTSPAGAVFHDICNILQRRWPLAEVVLAPTPVQGPEAVAGISGAIETLNDATGVDVIVVARGGGSVEELWAFNEEPVARAVFGSVVPVVSAVGHETDFTICDYVADMRAPTPSAAAELVAPDVLQVRSQIRGRLGAALSGALALVQRERSATRSLLGRVERQAADLSNLRQRIDSFERRALNSVEGIRRERLAGLRRCLAQLDALNPQATLDRGYAVVHKDGRVVSSIGTISGGDNLVIKVADGGFVARAAATGKSRRARNGVKPPRQEPAVQPVLFP
jgi:exodeoxyribonuclease VII large subunit